jgi:hypothetical protein
MKEQQYVIVKVGDDKPFLAQIEKIKGECALVVPQKDVHIKRDVIEVQKKQIRVVLGVNPLPGRVHGFDLNNLYRKTIEHSFWGPIHFFIKPEDSIMKVLKKGLDSSAKIVEKLGLEAYANGLFETEIRAKTGRYAGMYKHGGKDKPNRVWYAPEFSMGNHEAMEYVILHEFGHVIRFNGVLSNKMRNRWLRLYQKTIEQVKVPSKELDKILHGIAEQDESQVSFNAALKEATADCHPRFKKAILQWLKETHRISPRELEIMWRAGNTKDIADFWPDHLIDTHDLRPKVTEYATKNVEELFAECFSFYAQKKKLPEVCVRLLEESLARAKVERN